MTNLRNKVSDLHQSNMAASSSSTPFMEIRQENQSQITQQHQSSTDASSTAAQPLVPKKRRNQPGTPCK